MFRSIGFDRVPFFFVIGIAVWWLPSPVVAAEPTITITPRADGTLVDGQPYGPFNGDADDADWTFNQSSYEGTITRSTPDSGAHIEHRLVFEYDLQAVAYSPPVTASLLFNLRGVTIFPFPDVTVSVYTYPADLQETLADFSAAPASLIGQVTVVARQSSTSYILPANEAVSRALSDGSKKVALRFQIDPQTPHEQNQAFLDAMDSAPSSKPRLIVADAIPGDATGDRTVDLYDAQAFAICLVGPEQLPPAGCGKLDLDLDGDVDLRDHQLWQAYFGVSR